VALFVTAVDPRPGSLVLDLACGAGRHLRPLAEKGLKSVGLDLSSELLRRASAEAGGPWRLVRGDMRRLPFAHGSFGAVASFFTSFGYFATVGEDVEVLGEVRRVLEPGAGFMLDFLHAGYVRSNLVPEDRRRLGERWVVQRRRIEGRSVVKEIEIRPVGPGGRGERYEERVRLYEPEELEELLREAGLSVAARFGGYDGQPLDPDSERVLLAGRRT
jgi:SAM-dependent methyltransferase